MLDIIPNAEEMTALVGQSLYDVWNKLFIRLPNLYSLLSILPTIAMLKRIFNMYKSGDAK